MRFLFFGLAMGVLVVFAGGALLFKVRRDARKLVRYEAKWPKETAEGFSLAVASSLDRIFEDGKTLLKPAFTPEAKLSAAKNEYESFQIAVKAGRKELSSVRLITSDLIDEKTGGKIDRTNVSWRVVGFVPTVTPYYPVKYVGRWPDPLLPGETVDIEPEAVQPFWITVYVPVDAPKGDYRGQMTVAVKDVPLYKIPVSLRVYDFILPKESHLKTAFDFYGHITASRYPQGEREHDLAYRARINDLNDAFTIEMLKYRLNPILNIDPMSQADLGRVDRYRIYGLNNFSIGKRGGTFANNWPSGDEEIERLSELYQTYGETLKLNRMLDLTYIYTWDEGDVGNPRVAKICSMIHRAHPGLKNMVCYHGFWDPDEMPDWGKDIDIWCFQIDKFNEAKMRRLQSLGKEIWMYVSGPSGYTNPNLAIDFDSIDYRIIPWLCWKYDIKGLLYWCVNWWPKADPFQTAQNTDWEQNGNGLLFYPGKDGPLASLRLEIIRDGLEDYEYIFQLIGRIKEAKRQNLESAHKKEIDEAVKILTVDAAVAESMGKFTKDGGVLNERRRAIAEKIEEFDKFLKQNQSNESVPADNAK